MKLKQLIRKNIKHENALKRRLYNIKTDKYIAYTFM